MDDKATEVTETKPQEVMDDVTVNHIDDVTENQIHANQFLIPGNNPATSQNFEKEFLEPKPVTTNSEMSTNPDIQSSEPVYTAIENTENTILSPITTSVVPGILVKANNDPEESSENALTQEDKDSLTKDDHIPYVSSEKSPSTSVDSSTKADKNVEASSENASVNATIPVESFTKDDANLNASSENALAPATAYNDSITKDDKNPEAGAENALAQATASNDSITKDDQNLEASPFTPNPQASDDYNVQKCPIEPNEDASGVENAENLKNPTKVEDSLLQAQYHEAQELNVVKSQVPTEETSPANYPVENVETPAYNPNPIVPIAATENKMTTKNDQIQEKHEPLEDPVIKVAGNQSKVYLEARAQPQDSQFGEALSQTCHPLSHNQIIVPAQVLFSEVQSSTLAAQTTLNQESKLPAMSAHAQDQSQNLHILSQAASLQYGQENSLIQPSYPATSQAYQEQFVPAPQGLVSQPSHSFDAGMAKTFSTAPQGQIEGEPQSFVSSVLQGQQEVTPQSLGFEKEPLHQIGGGTLESLVQAAVSQTQVAETSQSFAAPQSFSSLAQNQVGVAPQSFQHTPVPQVKIGGAPESFISPVTQINYVSAPQTFALPQSPVVCGPAQRIVQPTRASGGAPPVKVGGAPTVQRRKARIVQLLQDHSGSRVVLPKQPQVVRKQRARQYVHQQQQVVMQRQYTGTQGRQQYNYQTQTQHQELESVGTQILRIDGKLMKGILAYGDDGNQYVIPENIPGANLSPFQVVGGITPGTYKTAPVVPPAPPIETSVIQASSQQTSVIQNNYSVDSAGKSGDARSAFDLLQSELADYNSFLPAQTSSALVSNPTYYSTSATSNPTHYSTSTASNPTYYSTASTTEPQVVDLAGLVVNETIPLVMDSETGQLVPETSSYPAIHIQQDNSPAQRGRTSSIEDEVDILFGNQPTSHSQSVSQTNQSTTNGLSCDPNSRGSATTGLIVAKRTTVPEPVTTPGPVTAPGPVTTSTAAMDDRLPINVVAADSSVDVDHTNTAVADLSNKIKSVARVKPFSTTGTEDNERKIYSVLSSSAKSSEEADRKVSKVKCQCSTHMIIGYPPSEVCYWEVGTARGNSSLFLSFDNSGVQHLYDQGLLRAFQSALSSLRTEFLKTDVSLEVSICLTCVRWAEKERSKKLPTDKQSSVPCETEIKEEKPDVKDELSWNEVISPKPKTNSVAPSPSPKPFLVPDKIKPPPTPEIKLTPPMKTVRSQPEPKMAPPPSPEAVKAEPKERIKRERRRSMEQNPEENIYKKVYNNKRRSLPEPSANKNSIKRPKKSAIYDLLCDIPGCNARVRSYHLLSLHFKNKHPEISQANIPTETSGAQTNDAMVPIPVMLSIMKKSNNELCQEIDGEANKEEGESIRRESDNVTENKDKENKELKRLSIAMVGDVLTPRREKRTRESSNAKETEKTTSKRRKSKVEVCVQNKPPQLSDLHEPPLVDQGSSLAGLDCLDEVESDALSSEAEDSVLNSHQKQSDHSLGGIGNTHNDDKVSIQSHKSPADVEDETLERLSVSLMDEFADGVSGTESRVKESESPKSSSAGLDGAPLSNTVVKSGGGKKNLLLKGLAIDMVSDTFSPLGSRRRRNKDDHASEDRGKSLETKSQGKKLEAKKISERKTSKEAKDPPTSAADDDIFKEHRSFAEILFKRVIEESVTAMDAYTILKKRVKDLDFMDFENEYRKFFLKRQVLPEKEVSVQIVDVLKHRSVRKSVDERSQSEVLTSPKSSVKQEIETLPSVCEPNVLKDLQSLEIKLKSIMESKKRFDSQEKAVLSNIKKLLDSA